MGRQAENGMKKERRTTLQAIRRRPRRSVNSLPRWQVTYIQKSPDTSEHHSWKYQNDRLGLILRGKNAEEAIERAEARFETLLGSEARPGWVLDSVNME